ncbi:MAG: TonB family protein [Candidatus Synoicihabitans palmerolidicus]|nr:TonB family protein [Candidatus Synoicihabitans palmerolidicus]
MQSSSIATSSSPMPRAAGLSALLHLTMLGTLLFVAWWSQLKDEDPPDTFEVVEGPDDDFAAPEAPRIETPSVQLDLPKSLPPKPRPQLTIIERVPEPPPKVVQPKPKPQPAPPKIEAVPEKSLIQKIEPERQKVTYDQFRDEHGAPKPQRVKKPQPIKIKSIDTTLIFDFTSNKVTVGAGGTAMSSSELDLSKRYIAFIIQCVRQSMEAAGVTELRDAGLQFSVSLDGVISDVEISRSSGSGTFDRAVLAAIRSSRGIGPPPTGRAERFSIVIRMSGT